uniref:Uncharacterized protein n=1 Tax=Anguilla anguilla TaxID=7936 RepID=A0A0E9PP65_ANGAN
MVAMVLLAFKYDTLSSLNDQKPSSQLDQPHSLENRSVSTGRKKKNKQDCNNTVSAAFYGCNYSELVASLRLYGNYTRMNRGVERKAQAWL